MNREHFPASRLIAMAMAGSVKVEVKIEENVEEDRWNAKEIAATSLKDRADIRFKRLLATKDHIGTYLTELWSNNLNGLREAGSVDDEYIQNVAYMFSCTCIQVELRHSRHTGKGNVPVLHA